MINTLIIIFSAISYTIVAIYLGYKIAILIWQPKELLKTGQDLLSEIDEMSKQHNELEKQYKDIVHVANEIEKTSLYKDTWYVQQLQTLAQYLKDKHKDNYVYDQMKHVEAFKQPIIEPEKENYDVDSLLEKITKNGLNSLTKEEVEYLKNPDNDSTRNL
jgi:hypothetical protein